MDGWDGWDLSQTTTTIRAPLAVLKKKKTLLITITTDTPCRILNLKHIEITKLPIP